MICFMSEASPPGEAALHREATSMGNAPPPKAELLQLVPAARDHWRFALRPRDIAAPGPGQESVWSFPRPPRVEPVAARIVVAFGSRVIADSRRGERVCETAGAPCYYVPPDDCDQTALARTEHWSVCEWKGVAWAYDVVDGARRLGRAAWSYPDPLDDLGCGFERIAGSFAFYATNLECTLDGERVTAQPGGFYGGWVTSNLTGPIKGVPGSSGW
jgi:uncharacterized protein (DUF427 family)